MEEMSKAYESKGVEDAIYKRWEDSGFFAPEAHQPLADNPWKKVLAFFRLWPPPREPYSIMMPPPNVTGVLHLGHALENTLMDTMARYQRMNGKKVLLLPGTDHAAVATQAKVEKLLVQEGVAHPREHFGREELLCRIREYAENSKATILKQIRRLGTSCDWSRLAYTFDEARSQAVNEIFVRMYNDGLIYRGHRVINWSVKGQSTCSDDELEYVERPAKLYYFKYSQDFPITIATTRPETKLGDTAVAVHPAGKWKKFIGQTILVKNFGQAGHDLNIKIIGNESVDDSFGTGALGVTPAHSQIDFEMYEQQKAKNDPIDFVAVIGTNGLMTAVAGSDYQGLTVMEAREKLLKRLSENGLLEKEEDIVQNVGTSDRFGDVVEALPLTQWFVAVNKKIHGRKKSLKDLMREAVATGHHGKKDQKISITPERFEKTYFHWIDNLRDWCISRQIWWGHRIPVWYRGDEIFVGETPSGDGWKQDPDTLDTWFSSGLWTFSTLGWPEKTKDFKVFHPTSWMQMGYELLFFWMARMILMSTYAIDQIPFKNVYIHGMLRDEQGRKFSKSLGTGIDPIEVIDEYGCDALRWSLISGISPGNDSKFYPEKIEGARNLVNKLWNISRYILTVIDKKEINRTQPKPKTLADQWILFELNRVTSEMTKYLDRYEFSAAGELLREFSWSQFADWYLEISKLQLADEKTKNNTVLILQYCLTRLLTLWHPFTPFVTEVIWKQMGGENLLMVETWPNKNFNSEKPLMNSFNLLQGIITVIRTLRADYKVEPAKKVEVVISAGKDTSWLIEQAEVIKHLARVENLTIVETTERPKGSVTAVIGSMEISLMLAGLVDIEKEKIRIAQEIEETKTYLTKQSQQLENKDFLARAPEKVVAEMRTKFDEAHTKLTKFEEQKNMLE